MSLPEIHHFKMVDEETGKMVAWARWGHPLDSLPADQREARQAELAAGKLPAQDSEVPTKKGGDLGAAPPGADAQACEDFFGTLDKMQAKYVNFETDYLLHLIATDPGYQGLGLGTTLIQIGLRLADEGKREAYLEGSEKGLSLYKKLGWREVDSIWGGGEPRFTVMIREPQG
jgi:GNAT superfamily N-acetyltransferase